MTIELRRVSDSAGQIKDRLRELVEIETPTRDVEASRRIAMTLTAGLVAGGADVRQVPSENGVHLVADVPGEDRDHPLLLIGHSDTVWPAGTLAGAVPWAEDGDRIAGPGVFDMKNGLVCIEWALRLVRDERRRAVRVIVSCDEEIGSATSTELVTSAARGCRAAIGFESPHPDGAFKLGRRGSSRAQIEVTGREAHAALNPEGGVSAINELVDQLVRVRSIVAAAQAQAPVLCNVGTIAGGTRANVVPGHAEAEIGLRFVDGHSQDDVLAQLQALTPVRPGATVETRLLTSRPAWAANRADTAWFEEIADQAHALGEDLHARPAAGAGDTNTVGALGTVPTIDGFGAVGGGAHAVDEHISFHSLLERIELLAALITA
ncbi:MAG: M20/M25/M40 family metallo-hydrolase [Pseudoclavibacter sp.]|jgi:glutamate carboxypeptidase